MVSQNTPILVQVSNYENAVYSTASTREGMTLNLTIGSFTKTSVDSDSQQFDQIALPHSTNSFVAGDPSIPFITNSIAIPNASDVVTRIVYSEYTDVTLENDLLPSRGILLDYTGVPYIKSNVYNQNSFFPKHLIVKSDPYLIRDARGLSIQITPFEYNPTSKILRVYTKMIVEVKYIGSNPINVNKKTHVTYNEQFDHSYKKLFINSDVFTTPEKSNSEIPRMLIICVPIAQSYAITYAQLRTLAGTPTTYVTTAVTGTTQASIKAYIQSQYDLNDGLTWVLLFGPLSDIPSMPLYPNGLSQFGVSDNEYGYLSGNDHREDVYIGRFQYTSTNGTPDATQIQTLMNRFDAYENAADESWMKNAIGVASTVFIDNEFDWAHMRNIRTDLLGDYFDNVSELYDGSQGGLDVNGNPNTSDLSTQLNTGASIFNYIGHGNETTLSTTGFTIDDVDNLTNYAMLPFGFLVACRTGDITQNINPLAATFLNTNNSNKPVGLIGCIGSSNNVDQITPKAAQDFFNAHLTSIPEHSSFGEIVSSAYNWMQDCHSWSDNTADSWIYFGDPSINAIFSRNCPNIKTVSKELYMSEYEVYARLQLNGQNLITNGAVVVYGASNEVNLLPGFQVQNGCKFDATNNGCLLPTKVIETITPLLTNVHCKASNIAIFPNPVINGYLNVNSDNEVPKTISVHNTLGVLVYRNTTPAKNNLIEIKFAGIYVVSIEMPSEKIVSKLIVQ
jgi:gingipain R